MKPQTEVIKYVVIDKKDTAKTDRSVHSLDKETITPQDGAALKLKSQSHNQMFHLEDSVV